MERSDISHRPQGRLRINSAEYVKILENFDVDSEAEASLLILLYQITFILIKGLFLWITRVKLQYIH